MLTIDQIRALSELDPEYVAVQESGALKEMTWNQSTDIHEMRAAGLHMIASLSKPDPAILTYTKEDIVIPTRDGTDLPARVYRPRDLSVDGGPGLVTFHGGGFITGHLAMQADLCTKFVSLGGVAVSIGYRLAPEFPFPTAVNDAFDTTNWTAQNAGSLGINPSKGLLIGGISAGADLCLAVSYLCRESRMSPPLTGVYASIMTGLDAGNVPDRYKDRFFSMDQNKDSYMLSAGSVSFFRKHYAPEPNNPLAWPAALPDHKGLPKTYFQVCGLDPLRDCGLITEQVWKDAGVPTRLDIYPGLPHGFWYVLPQIKATRQHSEDSLQGLKWLLDQ
ncbi:hypothetical protein S40293_05818 [Stachybotrys chartarum IBT 40293]|nr:hypothetical protein S40293_05818 [Stachybotrys chartarum IBT 40293]